MGKAAQKIIGGLEVVVGAALMFVPGMQGVGAALIGAGLTTIASAFIPTPKSPNMTQQSQDNRQMFRGAVVPHKIIYGQTRVSGPMYYLGSTGTNNAYMHIIIPLAGHAVSSIGNIIINGTLMDGVGADPKYAAVVRVKRHLGGVGQVADADLIAELVDATGAPLWDASHVGNGIAYIYVRLKFDKTIFPTGLHNIQADVKGKAVFDPRTGTTAWSDNWALCVRDYLTSSFGLGMQPTEIDDASFIAAANVSQEIVATANGGSQNRYTVNGIIDLSHRPADTIRALLTAGAGHLVPLTEGKARLIPGAYVTPTVTLTEADLRGDVSYAPHVKRSSLFNTVTGKFSGAETNWQLATFPQVGSAAFVAADNGELIKREISLPFCSDHERCQRIARLFLYTQRDGATLHMPCKLTALEVATMDNVMVTMPSLAFTNKVFRVIDWKLTGDLGVDLVLKADSASSYAWSNAYAAPFQTGGLVNFGTGGGAGSTSVMAYGALGDGVHDDTLSINNALDAIGPGGRVFFPRGEYFITAPLHLYDGMEFTGEGPMNITEVTFSATSITYANVIREYVVQLSTTASLREWILGDPIKLAGFATAAHNGLHAVVSVNDAAKTIVIKHSVLLSGSSEAAPAATAMMEQLRGGTLLRYKSLHGVSSTGSRFFDVTGFNNIRIHNVGFLGPGIDATSGGGLVFRRNAANKALTGYVFDNISVADVADNGILIEGPVYARFSVIRIRHCAFDGFVCQPSPYGGSTTACDFQSVYITSSRRGLVVKQGVYFTMNALVAESVAVGIDLYNCSGFTLNSPATETIKQKVNLGGQGVAIKMNACYGFTINSPTVFYNTEPTEWGKAAIECFNTSREKVAGVINGGRYHPSIPRARTVLAVQQTGYAAVAFISAKLSTLQADYWKYQRQFLGSGIVGVTEMNFRHQGTALSALSVTAYPGTNPVVVATVPPSVSDDGTKGHAVGDVWTDTLSGASYKLFDASTGAAVWKSEASMSVLVLDARVSQVVPITPTPNGRMTKIGRNFAADVATTNPYRIFESMHDGAGTMTLWLDMQDRLPIRYSHAISFGPLNPYNHAKLVCSDMIVWTHPTTGVSYLKVSFRSGGLGVTYGTNFNWGGSLFQNPAPAGTTVTVDVNNFTEVFTPTMVEYDQIGTRLHFFFPTSEFFAPAKALHVYGLMDDTMDGVYMGAASAVWDMSNASSSAGAKLAAALKVTYAVTHAPRKRVLDWGFYTTSTASFDSESVLTLTGGNEIRIYDPRGIVGIGTERTGTTTMAIGASTATIVGKDMDKYDWLAASNGVDHVYAQIIDASTVMFFRADTTNQCDVMYTGRRRKSIGWLLQEPIPYSAPPQTPITPGGSGGGTGGGAYNTTSYISAATSITSGAQVVLAHGLGVVPALVQMHVVNVTPEYGYVAGQRLLISSDINSDLSSASRGISCIVDATNITIRFGTSTTSILALDASTGLRQRLTNANWVLVAQAYAVLPSAPLIAPAPGVKAALVNEAIVVPQGSQYVVRGRLRIGQGSSIIAKGQVIVI